MCHQRQRFSIFVYTLVFAILILYPLCAEFYENNIQFNFCPSSVAIIKNISGSVFMSSYIRPKTYKLSKMHNLFFFDSISNYIISKNSYLELQLMNFTILHIRSLSDINIFRKDNYAAGINYWIWINNGTIRLKTLTKFTIGTPHCIIYIKDSGEIAIKVDKLYTRVGSLKGEVTVSNRLWQFIKLSDNQELCATFIVHSNSYPLQSDVLF